MSVKTCLSFVVLMSVLLMVLVSEDVSAEPFSYDDVTDTLILNMDVPDYAESESRPWEAHVTDIRRIVVSEGVTSIGDRAFLGCTDLVELSLSSSLKDLGILSFGDCGMLSVLSVNSNGLTVSEDTFRNAGTSGYGVRVTFGDNVTVMDRMFHGTERISSIDLCNMERLNDRALYDLHDTAIELPDTLEYIGDLALYNCRGIEEISLGEGLTHLGADAFYYCTNLRVVDFGCTDCDDLGSSGAFRNTGDGLRFRFTATCTYIPSNILTGVDVSELIIPDSVKEIGRHAFRDYSGPEVLLPNGLESIGEEAFLDCTGLYALSLTQSLTYIGRGAFDGCSGLREIRYSATLSDIQPADAFFRDTDATDVSVYVSDVERIPSNLFIGFTGLSVLTLQDSVTEIGDSTFSFCTYLEHIDLNKVGMIGERAFLGCDSLERVSFGTEAVVLGDMAFNSCSLKILALPDAIIGEHVFENNPLDHIIFNGSVECGPHSFSDLDGTTVTFMDGSISLDPVDSFSDCKDMMMRFLCDTIPEGILRSYAGSFSLYIQSSDVGDEAFRGCTGMDEVVLSDSVTSIGDMAFEGCTALKVLSVPESVVSIGDSAFSRLSSLEALDYCASSAMATFGKEPFTNTGVTGLVLKIHGDVPARMFSGTSAPNVGDLILDGTGSIGDHAFEHSPVTSISLPDSVRYVGEYAFSDTGIVSLVLTSDLSVSPWAFAGCTGLTTVTLDGITSVPDHLFDGCSALSHVEFDVALQSIGGCAFRETALASIQFPYTMRYLGSNAFEECGMLEHITFLGHDVTVADRAFYGCDLEVVEMQKGTILGEDVFTLPARCRVLLAECPFGTMISGCNVYPGQGYGGKVVNYDLGALGLYDVRVFSDTIVDVGLIPSFEREFTGWVFSDGSRYVLGTDPGEVTLYGTWVGAGHEVPEGPFIDPQILDIVAYVSMVAAIACIVLANYPRRSP